jgi:hypothetical protein
MAAQDEGSSEACLHCEINDVVQEHVAGQEQADPVALAATLEEAGAWYYVVDCATCKAVVPFKYAPEGEPIVCFPTMNAKTRALDVAKRHSGREPDGFRLTGATAKILAIVLVRDWKR